jgi:hypothetical protein
LLKKSLTSHYFYALKFHVIRKIDMNNNYDWHNGPIDVAGEGDWGSSALVCGGWSETVYLLVRSTYVGFEWIFSDLMPR